MPPAALHNILPCASAHPRLGKTARPATFHLSGAESPQNLAAAPQTFLVALHYNAGKAMLFCKPASPSSFCANIAAARARNVLALFTVRRNKRQMSPKTASPRGMREPLALMCGNQQLPTDQCHGQIGCCNLSSRPTDTRCLSQSRENTHPDLKPLERQLKVGQTMPEKKHSDTQRHKSTIR